MLLAMAGEAPVPVSRPKARRKRGKPPLGPWQTGTAVVIVLTMLALVGYVTVRTGEIPAQYGVPLLGAALWALFSYYLPALRNFLRGEADEAEDD